MGLPAIVTAGDRGAAKAVYGESKVYLELAGRPLVAHVVVALQHVPEVSEVWVVGDPERLGAVFAEQGLAAELTKPLHVVPQFRSLVENCLETWRRLLPGAGPEGRDPAPEDEHLAILYLSGDLPFATPQELSQFVRRALERQCDYACGLVGEDAMRAFYPEAPGAPGVRMAYFNTREGRFRQSNLHLVRPARIGNRHYIQDMYEHRYQRQLGPILGLAWELLTSERGGLRVLSFYLAMHLAGLADRHGWRRFADFVRRFIPLERLEQGCSQLLRTKFRFVVTDVGGCAVDIDNEHDYDAARDRFETWRALQLETASRVVGPLPLPATTEDR